MSRLLKITDLGSGIMVQGTDNVLYPDNATLTYPYNSIIVVTDESNMVTFRSAANNDVLFSGIIGSIQIGSDTVTKQNINAKFDAIANQESGGGDMSDYYTKEETNTLLEDKADIEDIPTEVSELQNDAGYITQAEVVVNESFPSAWMQALDMEDLITAINNDSDAVVGKCYMDTISLSDLPDNMQQAEVKAEIMSELEGTGKVILFTVTSSNQAPYHWEYTSAYGETGTWREWLIASDIANFFDGAEYDSNTKRINFKHGNTVKTYIDATAFIKDGMVDSVAISNGNLVITFNTDAGKQPISIPLTDIFNPANYYDKTTADNTFATQVVVNEEIAARIAGDGALNIALGTKADKSDTYTKSQVDDALALKQDASTAFSGNYNDLTNKPDLSVYAESANLATVATSGSYNDLTNTPTIPAAQVNSDWNASSGVAQILNKPDLTVYATKSELDTKEEVISTALNDLEENKADASDLASKQDTLVSGTNIKTINNESILGSGNITIQGGGTQVQSDWNQSDSTAVDYIKNKPDLSIYAQSANLATVATSGSYNDLTNTPTIPAAQVNSDWNANSGVAQILNKPDLTVYATKAEMDIKEEVISTALNDLEENKADKTEIPSVSEKADKVANATNGDFAALDANGNLTDSGHKHSDYQATLVSGTNIKTINNESILGSGNITIQSGGTQVQSDWNQSDNTQVDYIKNKPTNLVKTANNGLEYIEVTTLSQYNRYIYDDILQDTTLYIVKPDEWFIVGQSASENYITFETGQSQPPADFISSFDSQVLNIFADNATQFTCSVFDKSLGQYIPLANLNYTLSSTTNTIEISKDSKLYVLQFSITNIDLTYSIDSMTTFLSDTGNLQDAVEAVWENDSFIIELHME